jgi:hypothetical protein
VLSEEGKMASLWQIQIEFPENIEQGELTKEDLRDTIEKAFLEIGVERSVVQMGVEDIDLRKESLLGVDPGVATLIVAIIGVGIELIKLGTDLYKQHIELEVDTKEHRQEIDLELAKLELERQKFELERKKYEAPKSANRNVEPEVDEERIRAFLDSVLIARLVEQHDLEISHWNLRLIERS